MGDDPWYTVTDSFDADFGVGEWHGTNVFFRDGDKIFRTYFINNRGDEQMGAPGITSTSRRSGARRSGRTLPKAIRRPRPTSGGTGTTATSKAPRPTRGGSKCRTPARPRSASSRPSAKRMSRGLSPAASEREGAAARSAWAGALPRAARGQRGSISRPRRRLRSWRCLPASGGAAGCAVFDRELRHRSSGMVPMYLLMSAFHFGALAEADRRLARSRPSVLTRPRRNFDKIPPR